MCMFHCLECNNSCMQSSLNFGKFTRHFLLQEGYILAKRFQEKKTPLLFVSEKNRYFQGNGKHICATIDWVTQRFLYGSYVPYYVAGRSEFNLKYRSGISLHQKYLIKPPTLDLFLL